MSPEDAEHLDLGVQTFLQVHVGGKWNHVEADQQQVPLGGFLELSALV